MYEVENEINLEYPQLSKKLTKDIYFYFFHKSY
nr:hypothetical protein [Metamycoplasma orale]